MAGTVFPHTSDPLHTDARPPSTASHSPSDHSASDRSASSLSASVDNAETRAIPVVNAAATGLRTPSLIAGIALAVMAVLAPIGVFGALSAGLTGTTALIVLAVAALDVVVAIALVPLLSTGGELLAKFGAGMRLAYAAVFAAAAGSLVGAPDVEQFQASWDAALLLFGAHLVLIAVAIVRSSVVPTWIGILVAIAGLGYLADSVVALVAPGTGIEFGVATFIGEVALLVWLIARGGAERRGRRARWW